MKNPFRYFKTSPEIIRLAVMMYVRFPLSLRNVEDLLHERGIEVSHETIRFWWNRFGPIFAAEIRKKRMDRMRAFSGWRWHLDEMFVKSNGEGHYLWRAVNQEGEVLEAFVSKKRDRAAALDHNRLGFAIQLGTVRFLGTFVADPAHVPRAVVEHVAAQLGIDDLSALERYWDSQTRWDHQAEIRRRYRYQPFGQAPTHLPFLRWLFGRAWLADERPAVLFDRATAYLLEHKILLPGVTTLARLVAAVRERAKRRLWKQLAARVDRSTERLESLLVVPEGSSQSTLESLRRGPVRASGAGLVDAICRVEQIRELGVADFDLAGLPEAAVRRLARYTAGAGERGQLRQKYREGQRGSALCASSPW